MVGREGSGERKDRALLPHEPKPVTGVAGKRRVLMCLANGLASMKMKEVAWSGAYPVLGRKLD